MPAEWEPHAATWLAWPVNRTTWPGSLLKEVEKTYLGMIAALLPGERVNLCVPDDRTARGVAGALPRSARTDRLIFHKVKTVDAWIRDWGPIFIKKNVIARTLRSGEAAKEGTKQSMRKDCFGRLRRPRNDMEIAFTKWRFNAWGGKYRDLARDNGVVDRIAALERFQRFDVPMVLEGGSIDVNGRGACLTTEHCLLDPTRNPELSRKGIERHLKKYLGLEKIIWLKEGIEGDDTDGHVDDSARFVGLGTILAAVENDPLDKNRSVLKENLRILKSSGDQDGRPFRVIELPMPGRIETKEGERLPASYANFYISNRAVLVPVYNHPNDKLALKTLRGIFRSRKVAGIECAALVHGLGSIHCVTQQEPA